jgi:UDP-glucose 4-epimerase
MRVLVTGGAGFIASHVVDAYLSLGHDVAVVDDLSRGSERNLNPKARFYKVDIRDGQGLQGVFSAEKPEVVNHHAAQMDVRRGVREPRFDADVNILGSINLLGLAVEHQVKRIIYVSTAGAAYGEPEHLPVREDAPINPITPYGISKHTVEHYLFTYNFLYGLSYVVLRYGNVYGPRQSSQGEAGVFAIFAEQLLAKDQPVIYGDGSKTRDYVYVSDVATANVTALTRGTGEVFNIAAGVATRDDEIFGLVRDQFGQQELRPRYVDRRPGEIEHITLDISKAQRLLQWTPKIDLAEGARLTLQYFQKHAREKVRGEAAVGRCS